MNSPLRNPSLLLIGALCLLVSGCLPKPNTMATRSYLLSPLPANPSVASTAPAGPSVGIGMVKLPDYLLKTSLAVRAGSHEITYLESSLWAERLDTSFQRTLAANLAVLLPTDRVRLSSWSRDEVSRVVYVSVDRFDVDSQGTGTLVAWWRITSGSADRSLASGEFRDIQSGPTPSQRPDAIAATLSRLTDQLGRSIAIALRESLAPNVPTP